MSDAEPWPETLRFPTAPDRHDTLTMAAAIEHWWLEEPIRRKTVVSAHGTSLSVKVSLAMAEGAPDREWSITFARPLSTRLVLSLLDALITSTPGGPPVVVPTEDR